MRFIERRLDEILDFTLVCTLCGRPVSTEGVIPPYCPSCTPNEKQVEATARNKEGVQFLYDVMNYLYTTGKKPQKYPFAFRLRFEEKD